MFKKGVSLIIIATILLITVIIYKNINIPKDETEAEEVVVIDLEDDESATEDETREEELEEDTENDAHSGESKETSNAPSTDNVLEDDAEIHDDCDPKGEKNEDLAQFIAHYHGILNEFTDQQSGEPLNWDEIKIVMQEITQDTDDILKDEQSYPPSMEIDLERTVQLFEIASKNNDPEAINFIHRLLHDLDVEYNAYYPNNKFGFSNYDGGGENQSQLATYIEKHQLTTQ